MVMNEKGKTSTPMSNIYQIIDIAVQIRNNPTKLKKSNHKHAEKCIEVNGFIFENVF